jgi:hypothetical protein
VTREAEGVKGDYTSSHHVARDRGPENRRDRVRAPLEELRRFGNSRNVEMIIYSNFAPFFFAEA